MKKFLFTATMLVSFTALSHAQQRGVGINTTTPAATLDVVANNADPGMPDAVLVPRMTAAELGAKNSAYNAEQNGALVFVLSGTGTAGTRTENVTGTGFYYYNSGTTRWVPVGGGSATDTSIYTGNGTLTSVRTVDQANNNLTFTTGTARTIINGTFETQGAVYSKTRSVVGDLVAGTWQANDYNIVLTGTTNNISLPDATTNSGRVISLTNQTGGTRTFVTGAGNVAFRPLNVATIQGGRGLLMVSDGSVWQIIGGYN
ncbi:hypothetical protein HNP38_001442 [Chryseobacterium defluvii]|uniref:Uncharacterized protein n=1 Tax=Chryseobacterium defluvii TaxID=160396 RepID=A0A840KF76_9FLAO|nr:hypothetical protein [Chryseobacterium defluvii]MBB4806170.1 hypothetical protein [Chryseobacterium defluvii]